MQINYFLYTEKNITFNFFTTHTHTQNFKIFINWSLKTQDLGNSILLGPSSRGKNLIQFEKKNTEYLSDEPLIDNHKIKIIFIGKKKSLILFKQTHAECQNERVWKGWSRAFWNGVSGFIVAAWRYLS